jgi:hypothetical protein
VGYMPGFIGGIKNVVYTSFPPLSTFTRVKEALEGGSKNAGGFSFHVHHDLDGGEAVAAGAGIAPVGGVRAWLVAGCEAARAEGALRADHFAPPIAAPMDAAALTIARRVAAHGSSP